MTEPYYQADMVTPHFDAMTDDEFVQWLRDNQPGTNGQTERDADCPECGDIGCRCGIDYTAPGSSVQEPEHPEDLPRRPLRCDHKRDSL